MRSRIVVCLMLSIVVAAGAKARGESTRTANVIVVTLDGFRPQEFFGGAQADFIESKAGGVADRAELRSHFWRETPEARRQALLPFVWGVVARQGQIFGDPTRHSSAKVTNGKNFSYPGYSEMFCGFGDDRIDSNDKKPNPNLSVLEFLNGRPAFRGKVSVCATWDVFPSIFRTATNGLKIQAGWDAIVDDPLTERQRMLNEMTRGLPRFWSDNVYDAVTTGTAREHLLRHKPRVLYIGLGETDEWAHDRRYDLYLDSAHAADAFLGDLWKTIQGMPEYRDKTALVMTTDHGRGETPRNWTDHGEKAAGSERIWIAVMGPDTPALGVREGVHATQSQVAATVARLVGEDFNAASPKSAPPLPDVVSGR